jgi:pyridoxal phosphate enzyme (YggS family)
VKVGRLVLDDEGEQLGEIHYNSSQPAEPKNEQFPPEFQAIMATIADNLQAIRKRLAGSADATLLAVSKGQRVERIREAVAAGQKAFGENYVQEALEKMTVLEPQAPGLEWHLIGPLQSNKTRAAAEHFDWVQTVSSEKIARRLSEQRPASLGPLNVLIQVNVSGESTKSGVSPAAAAALASKVAAMKGIRLRGLMAIPEPGADRSRYAEVRRIFQKLKDQFVLDTLSMGMSDDMDVAIAEGSTMVRIGTAIFGARKKHKSAA